MEKQIRFGLNFLYRDLFWVSCVSRAASNGENIWTLSKNIRSLRGQFMADTLVCFYRIDVLPRTIKKNLRTLKSPHLQRIETFTFDHWTISWRKSVWKMTPVCVSEKTHAFISFPLAQSTCRYGTRWVGRKFWGVQWWYFIARTSRMNRKTSEIYRTGVIHDGCGLRIVQFASR